MRPYGRRAVAGIWALAAAPMAIASWVVAPALHEGALSGEPLAVSLIVALTGGLAWQCLLALALVGAEQRSLRWSRLRGALWLRPPTDPRSGRHGGRVWLWALAFMALYGVVQVLPLDPAPPDDRDLAAFFTSGAGEEAFRSAWGLFAIVVAHAVLNTVLGEELLFRGVLLPRMRGAFDERDWPANGILFGLYHVHQPWNIPSAIIAGTLAFAYPTRRFGSAWMGIAVHSTQSVVLVGVALALTLG